MDTAFVRKSVTTFFFFKSFFFYLMTISFLQGERVEIWSTSSNCFLPGFVIEIVHPGIPVYEFDIHVPVGSVKVQYDIDGKTKWVLNNDVGTILRKIINNSNESLKYGAPMSHTQGNGVMHSINYQPDNAQSSSDNNTHNGIQQVQSWPNNDSNPLMNMQPKKDKGRRDSCVSNMKGRRDKDWKGAGDQNKNNNYCTGKGNENYDTSWNDTHHNSKKGQQSRSGQTGQNEHSQQSPTWRNGQGKIESNMGQKGKGWEQSGQWGKGDGSKSKGHPKKGTPVVPNRSSSPNSTGTGTNVPNKPDSGAALGAAGMIPLAQAISAASAAASATAKQESVPSTIPVKIEPTPTSDPVVPSLARMKRLTPEMQSISTNLKKSPRAKDSRTKSTADTTNTNTNDSKVTVPVTSMTSQSVDITIALNNPPSPTSEQLRLPVTARSINRLMSRSTLMEEEDKLVTTTPRSSTKKFQVGSTVEIHGLTKAPSKYNGFLGKVAGYNKSKRRWEVNLTADTSGEKYEKAITLRRSNCIVRPITGWIILASNVPSGPSQEAIESFFKEFGPIVGSIDRSTKYLYCTVAYRFYKDAKECMRKKECFGDTIITQWLPSVRNKMDPADLEVEDVESLSNVSVRSRSPARSLRSHQIKSSGKRLRNEDALSALQSPSRRSKVKRLSKSQSRQEFAEPKRSRSKSTRRSKNTKQTKPDLLDNESARSSRKNSRKDEGRSCCDRTRASRGSRNRDASPSRRLKEKV